MKLTEFLEDARKGFAMGLLPQRDFLLARKGEHWCGCAAGAAWVAHHGFPADWPDFKQILLWARAHYELKDGEMAALWDGFDGHARQSDAADYVAAYEAVAALRLEVQSKNEERT
jgi:hypothetical protein